MIVGMDFGTTNSGMSYYDGRKLALIPLDPASENPLVTRTALYITNQKRVYMGRGAINTYYEQNLNRKVKYQRVWVGEVTMTFAELPEFVRDLYIDKDVLSPGRLFVSFKTSLRSPEYIGTVVGTHFYFIEDIVALYLYLTKRRAEEYLKTELSRIVLGRPVRFSTDPQQDSLAAQRLTHAAFRAGYEEVYLQYEPIAAAYYYESGINRPENVMIFDFGGGTLDISIARLGDPKNREILANGGIPIAGDVFDQKLVRAKLPQHFGEGSSYRADNGTPRPVPIHYYDSFGDWQEMLELNKPHMLDVLRHLEPTASARRQIRMLIDLISSSYSLRMFDVVEAAKRELSNLKNAVINLEGPGFRVRDLVTRAEFDRLIQEETRAIEDLLDSVIAQAGLAPDQIQAVVRTGGSAQIPVFIEMLQQRFGKDRVRSIDTFSSVTSGLGIIGHNIERGETEARVYRRSEWSAANQVRTGSRAGIPPVDLDLLKRMVDAQETRPDEDQSGPRLLCITTTNDVLASMPLPHDWLNPIDQETADSAPVETVISLKEIGLDHLRSGLMLAALPESKLVLATSEFRLLVKTAQELANLGEMNLNLTDTDSLHTDDFGSETVRALVTWPELHAAQRLALVASSGQVKVMPAEALLHNIDQPQPYQLERMPGYPVALIPADNGGEVVLITSSGGAARIEAQSLILGTRRLLKLRQGETVIRAFYLAHPDEILLVVANGHAKRLHTRTLPFATGTDITARTILKHEPRALIVRQPDAALWAVTGRRLCPILFDAAPLDGSPAPRLHPILKLYKGEEILGLIY
ncbi:MAG: Hsp70 family protein [Chloroflexi bacterium]|nr:Hsp70 family protein [Chloroflexota bacterium]